jgi:predicted lactoylglutathione lyase
VPGEPPSIAFSAPDRETVDAFHAAAVEAGGVDNGRSGLRPHYHPGYYAAFVLDPDGNNVEAVFHGDH